jgi:hypothetical protein
VRGSFGKAVMAEIERIAITLPSDMASVVRGAVEGGNQASTREVVRQALRDWKMQLCADHPAVVGSV